MHPKIIGLVLVLGTLLAFGIDTRQLATLAIVILMFVCSFSLILRGKWIPQFGGSLIGLLFGPCIVAVVLRVLFAELNLHFLTGFSLGWTGILLLAIGLFLLGVISYFFVKKRLRVFQPTLPPATNERQPVYAPRRRDSSGE